MAEPQAPSMNYYRRFQETKVSTHFQQTLESINKYMTTTLSLNTVAVVGAGVVPDKISWLGKVFFLC
jgi:hypothetical protein